MKVKELIEKLKKCNPESEVYFDKEVWEVEFDEDGYGEDRFYNNSYNIDYLIEDEEYNVVTLYEED